MSVSTPAAASLAPGHDHGSLAGTPPLRAVRSGLLRAGLLRRGDVGNGILGSSRERLPCLVCSRRPYFCTIQTP